jgi:hypothetical protein
MHTHTLNLIKRKIKKLRSVFDNKINAGINLEGNTHAQEINVSQLPV